jgi:hypothetical protein
MKDLELLLDLAVEKALDRICRQSAVTLVTAVDVEQKWRMSIGEVFDTEGERHIVQQAPPGPTMTFGSRCNRLFSNNSLPCFVIPRFWGFRCDSTGGPNL